MIRAYCHKVIKLSGVLQSYAPEKECVKNVHGVREDFLREGRRRGRSSVNNTGTPLNEEAEGQVYYIGKILWAKGFEQMLELEEFYHEITGKYFAVDIYGSGPEEEEIQRAFHGRRRNKKPRAKESRTDLEDLLSREYITKKLQSIKISSQEFSVPKTWYELLRESREFCSHVDERTYLLPTSSPSAMDGVARNPQDEIQSPSSFQGQWTTRRSEKSTTYSLIRRYLRSCVRRHSKRWQWGSLPSFRSMNQINSSCNFRIASAIKTSGSLQHR